ncbi:MAG: cellulose biosynthesis cyclic di-GMP-binding regulatory protein BcsB [Pseudomonadota bacterium]
MGPSLHTDNNRNTATSTWRQQAGERKNRMRFLLGCLLGLLVSLPAMAEEILIPLQKLTPHSLIKLKCIGDAASLEIPISDRWHVKKVTLNLHYISSISMIGDLSQLVIRINDVPIAQVKLNPLMPDALLAVNVPPQYLKPGYNKLSFAVAQRYSTTGCENPCAPGLWTDISMQDSSLQVEYELNPVPLKLSSIAKFLFDPKTYPEAHVNLITEDRSAENLTLAALIASGVARHYDYRKVTFGVSPQIRPGVDNIVIGRTAFIQQFLGPYQLSLGTVKGGYLKVFPLPTDGGADNARALVVVSGENFDHVKMAALTFSNISFAYPGTQELNAFEFKMPEVASYGGRDVLTANKVYDFKTLNFPTSTFQGMNPTGKELSFRLPSDMLVLQNHSAKLMLNFAYGSGMRESSAIHVVVNGISARAIPLNDKNGHFIQNYQIDLPTYLFKPGANVISFGLELHPELKECELTLTNNLFVSIFDNSTLAFPDMPHFVELPKLELLMLNGFPFTRWPDGYDSLIYLTDPSSNDAVAAALNLVGLMTQKNGFPLLNIRVGFHSLEKWKGDVIVIGDQKTMPDALKAKSPLHTSNTSLIPYPVVRGWQNETATLAHSRQISALGEGSGLLMQFESPFQVGRTIMTLSADEPADLYRLGEALLDPEVQGQIYGDLVLVEMTQPKFRVTSMMVGKTYATGKQGDVSWIDSFLYAYPYAYHALLGLLILGLAFAVYVLLKRYRATRKLGEAQKKEPKKE